MKLFRYTHRYDFGHDWCFQVLNVRNWSLLQVSVGWNDIPTWPYVQIKSGYGSTLSTCFWVYKFGLDVDILSRTWKWYYEKETDYTELD